MNVIHFSVGGVEDTWILTRDMIERRFIDHFDVTQFNYFCLSWNDSNFYTVALTIELFVWFSQKNNDLIHFKKVFTCGSIHYFLTFLNT